MADKMKILLFIPARNEGRTIGDVAVNCRGELSKIGYEAEVLVIDDGSSDDTCSIAKSRGCKVIRYQEHVGLGFIFQEAVKYAVDNHFDIMMTMDGDGQFCAQDIQAVLSPVAEGNFHLSSGSRFSQGSEVCGIPSAKRWGNRQMAKIISWILGKEYKDVSCGFRAFSREALLNLNLSGQFTYTQEVFLNLGFKGLSIKEVPVKVNYFQDRQSRIAGNLWRYAIQTLKIIFKSIVYYRPMKFFGAISAICFLFGLPLAAVFGIRFLITDMVSPFKAWGIFSLVLVIMGFAFFIAGVLLQLISRIQLNTDKILYYEKKRRQ